MRSRLKLHWVAVLMLAPATVLFLYAQQQAPSSGKPKAPAAEQKAKSAKPKHLGFAGFSAFPHAAAAPASEIARGKAIFQANCSFCHGDDAMGGEGGGPELLLTQVVMDDRNGDIITPVVRHGFPPQMPSFSSLSDTDLRDIAAFLHSLPVTNRGQGTKLNILVGNAQAGEAYFKQHCTTCHSTTGSGPGSLAGIGGKYAPKYVQNMIVSGGSGRLGFGPNVPSPPPVPPTTVTVTLASGKTLKGKLDNLSPFIVALTEADGTYRSFPRNGAVPKVVVHDPLMWHINMLAKWKDTDIHNLTAYLVTLK